MKGHSSARTILLAIVLAGATGVAAADKRHPASSNAVTHWNAVALQVLPVEPGLLLDSRAFAITHAAIHDALNGIERRYQPYTADLSSPGASIDAAVATAARDVLVALSPSRQTVIEIAYAATLGAVPNGPAKDAGIAVGRESARQNLVRRAGDGLEMAGEPVYTPTGAPGDYDFTPPFDQAPFGPIALLPGWGRLTPFAIELSAHQVAGPDPLSSEDYAVDFNRVKDIGRFNSATRSPEQTDIALFWFEFSPIGWNRIANTIVRQHNLDVWKAARVLALVNFALADGYIAGFAAKYQFRFWRPETAIHRAADDGNDETTADETWLPLVTPVFFTPPVPDYPSTHTVLGAAVAEVLIQTFGDRVDFAATSTTLPGVVRHFKRFSDAAKENGLSRLYGGIHFLHAVNDGYQQGKSIGSAVSQLLPPLQQ